MAAWHVGRVLEHNAIDYKGYDIVLGTKRSKHQPYTANYSITKPTTCGENEDVHQGFRAGVFQTQEEAWADALATAKAYIDTRPPLR